MFELSDNALVQLRTEDMGYQVCEVEIPNFEGTSTAAKEFDTLTNIQISPNPATESISISIDYSKLEVFTAMGRLVHRSVDNAAINIRSLKAGTYFLHITDEQDRSFMKKIIKL